MKGSDRKLPFSPSPPLPRRAHSEAAFEETGPFLEHSKLSCQFQSRISPGNSLPFSSLLDPLGAHVPAPLEFVLITRPFLTSLTSSRPSYLSFSPFSLFRWPFHPSSSLHGIKLSAGSGFLLRRAPCRDLPSPSLRHLGLASHLPRTFFLQSRVCTL